VTALATQNDGKIIVAGGFTSIGGQSRAGLARLLADGSVDPTFANVPVTGLILAIAVQADGRIVVAGDFTQIGTAPRSSIARLNADGTVDLASTRMSTWAPMVGSATLHCRPAAPLCWAAVLSRSMVCRATIWHA